MLENASDGTQFVTIMERFAAKYVYHYWFIYVCIYISILPLFLSMDGTPWRMETTPRRRNVVVRPASEVTIDLPKILEHLRVCQSTPEGLRESSAGSAQGSDAQVVPLQKISRSSND